MQGNIKGSGLDYKTANATFNATVRSAFLMGYNYNNVSVDGSIAKGVADIKAMANDPNLKFNLTAKADITSYMPKNIQAEINLDTISLNALKFMPDTIGLKGQMQVNLTNADPDDLAGNIFVDHITVSTPTQSINTDSITIDASGTPENKLISLRSDALHATISGQYKLTEMAAALQQTINKYYAIPNYKPAPFSPQNFSINAVVYPSSPLVLQFMPALKGSDSAIIKADYNSAGDYLSLVYKQKQLMFDGTQLDSINLVAETNADMLDYSLSLQQVKTTSLQLNRTLLNGNIANNQVDANLRIFDKKNTAQYQLGVLLNQVVNAPPGKS